MKTENKDKIEINAVEINIAGTKLRLSLEQVAELKKILDKAFPAKETIYVPGPTTIIHEWPVPQWPRYDEWKITCRSDDSTSGTLCLAAG